MLLTPTEIINTNGITTKIYNLPKRNRRSKKFKRRLRRKLMRDFKLTDVLPLKHHAFRVRDLKKERGLIVLKMIV